MVISSVTGLPFVIYYYGKRARSIRLPYYCMQHLEQGLCITYIRHHFCETEMYLYLCICFINGLHHKTCMEVPCLIVSTFGRAPPR